LCAFFDFSGAFRYHAGKKEKQGNMTDYSFSLSKELAGPASGSSFKTATDKANLAMSQQIVNGNPKKEDDDETLDVLSMAQNKPEQVPPFTNVTNWKLWDQSELKIQGPDRHWPSYLRFDLDLFFQKLLRKDELNFAHS
jgi:hypothetical protein